MEEPLPNWVRKLTIDERSLLAKEKIKSVAEQVHELISIHENNRILLYTDTVCSRIPISYAANTYNQLTECLFRYQVVRLCALWDDSRGKDRASIPVVTSLIRDKQVWKLVADEKYRWWTKNRPRNLNPATSIEIDQQIISLNERHQEKMGRRDADEAEKNFESCIEKADRIERSDLHTSLRRLRDTRIAHSLITNASAACSIPTAMYGQEEELLNETVQLAGNLLLLLTGTNHGWDEVTSFASRCASELWDNFEFNLKQKPLTRDS